MKLRSALLVLSLAAVGVSNGAQTSGGTVFVLEVPELKLSLTDSTPAAMPHSFVSRLAVRVLRSSQEVSPGKIFVRINGEAANTIMSTRTAESTIVCDLDLYFRPGFLLHAGRNTIEASAESIYGRIYFAAFLLDVRDEPESLREIQRETVVNRAGEKPPLIYLINPQGPVENQRQLTLKGNIEGGVAPVSLTVDEQPVSLTGAPPPGSRGVQIETEGTAYTFSTPVKIGASQDSLEVVATDAHNNRTRLSIPVVQGTRSTGRRYAVVIGVSHYRDSRIPGLQFADKDAQAVRDFLLDPNGGGMQPGNLLYLENQDASYARIRNALFDFLTRPGPNDLAIVYFAGHGTNDRRRPDNYYLLGYDTDADSLGSTGVPMWDLQQVFERTLQANVVTLVDACHSAAIGQTMPNLVNQRWTTVSHGSPNRAIITASNIAEYSRESPKWGGGHGVFTWFLLRGLNGEADANHDGKVSVGELFDFVHQHVVEETGGSQTPTALAGLARGLLLTHSFSKISRSMRPLSQPASRGATQ